MKITNYALGEARGNVYYCLDAIERVFKNLNELKEEKKVNVYRLKKNIHILKVIRESLQITLQRLDNPEKEIKNNICFCSQKLTDKHIKEKEQDFREWKNIIRQIKGVIRLKQEQGEE